MKKITDSLLKRIVRQSLNESYGLLNEYDITTTRKIGDIPIGAKINNMTLPQCPDGGFCYGDLEQAKKDIASLSAGGSGGLIQKYCPSKNVPNRKGKGIAMGKPTYNTTKIQQLSGELWSELTDTGMDPADIKKGFRSLENFPNFCKSEELFYSYWESLRKNLMGRGQGAYNGFEGNSNYGIINDDDDDRDDYFNEIALLFQNSIDESDRQYEAWLTELNANYKIVTDKVAADKLAADKLAADKVAADNTAEENRVKIGSAGQENFMINHPTLDKSSEQDLSAKDNSWNARVYKLDTGDNTIDKFLYGVIIYKKDSAPLAVKFRDDALSDPVTLDPDVEWRLKYGISQSDTWEYDDVIISDDNSSIALTTNTELENPFITTESYRHKGFRHNLLTEIELKYDKSKPQTGLEVGNIMSKLGLPAEKNPTFGPQVLDAVIKHQKEKGLKRTDGVVDDETYESIMAIPAPAFELSSTKKSKGDDVTLIQQKLGIDVGLFGPKTETAVKEFQEKYKNRVTPPLRIDGVVDQATFDLIKKLKGGDSRKVYSGAKTNYVAKDWIIITPNRGKEGNIFIDQKYYKIKSVSPDRMTVVLDLQMSNTTLNTSEQYSELKVGGMTAKILFGNEAEGLTKNAPIANNNRDNNSGTRSNNNNSGTRSNNNNSGTRSNNNNSSTNTEKQKQRDVRNKEFCDTLRQVKQYINNTKGGDLTVNCKKTQKTLNQIMMALTGGTIVNPATQVTPVDQPQYNVVQPESPTNQSL